MSAYLIAAFNVEDADGYARYQEATVHLIEEYGIKVHAMTEDVETIAGEAPAKRIGILEFPDKETLHAWYNSPAYQATGEILAESLDTKFIVALEGIGAG